MLRLAVIVLAAGRSSRFSASGAHKLLARIDETPVVRASVNAAVVAKVGDVLVVTGAESNAVEAAIADLPVRVVHAPDFADGMSASLRCGVAAARDSADAVMIALGDQPTMRPEAYQRVTERWRATGAAIVTPRYADSAAPAHPTLFAATVFEELSALRGDVGARAVVARSPERVAEALLEWPAPRDIDTPEDFAAVMSDVAARARARVVRNDHTV